MLCMLLQPEQSTVSVTVSLSINYNIPVIHIEEKCTSCSIQLIAQQLLELRNEDLLVRRPHRAELL